MTEEEYAMGGDEWWEKIPGFGDRHKACVAGGRLRRRGKGNNRWVDSEEIKMRSGGDICLYYEGSAYDAKIAVFVLRAFRGECPPGQEAMHLDGNASNNDLMNLAWGTHKENEYHKRKHNTAPRGASHPTAKLSSENVKEIRSLGEGELSHEQIAQKFSISGSHVGQILSGKYWPRIADKKPGWCVGEEEEGELYKQNDLAFGEYDIGGKGD